MKPITNNILLSAVSSTTESDAIGNQTADVASIEVSGTATSFTLSVQGKVNTESGWTNLAVINMASLALAQSITAFGIYEAGIEGMTAIRLNLSAVTGGNVTATVKTVNTAE